MQDRTPSPRSARQSAIAGVLELRTTVWVDERGSFQETFARSRYRKFGIADEFVQDNLSYSHRNVLRGLHGAPRMSKIVQVVSGEVFDVVVDARVESPTFGRWQSFVLSEQSHTQIYIPAGCLHGFLTLSDEAIFCYKQSTEYDPAREIGVRWDDPALAVAWPDLGEPTILSEKDRNNRSFRDAFPS